MKKADGAEETPRDELQTALCNAADEFHVIGTVATDARDYDTGGRAFVIAAQLRAFLRDLAPPKQPELPFEAPKTIAPPPKKERKQRKPREPKGVASETFGKPSAIVEGERLAAASVDRIARGEGLTWSNVERFEDKGPSEEELERMTAPSGAP